MRRVKYSQDSSLNQYFAEINSYKPLSRYDERELSLKIHNGDIEALNKLVTSNLKFVVMVAKNYMYTGVPFYELISSGNEGLIKAANKFDGEKGIKFISYAVWWVKNSIQETIENYIKNEGCDVDDYVYDKTTDNYDDEHEENINELYETEINHIMDKNEAIELLTSCLKEREYKIITMYYGLNNEKEQTLDEIGKVMNLTQERVRKIKDKAMVKLKCNALEYDDFNDLKSLV